MTKITIEKGCEKKIIKLFKKDKLMKDRFYNKIEEIAEKGNIGVPKTGRYKGLYGIHINPYVLVYDYSQKDDEVIILIFDHHDVVYG